MPRHRQPPTAGESAEDGIGEAWVDHVAFGVPRLAEAVDFFCEVLGAEWVMESDLDPPEGGPWMRRQLDVDEEARATLAALRLGPVTNVELWEYKGVSRRQRPPRCWDIAGHHLGFYVTDMTEATSYLSDHGVGVRDGPTLQANGPDRGECWTFFETPWGLPMKLVSWPAEDPESHGIPGRFGPCAEWSPGSGIPTARNVDHLSLTVPSLGAAVKLFCSHLGAELLYGPYVAYHDATFMLRHFGSPRSALIKRSFLRLGPTANLELVEYRIDGQERKPRKNSDVGAHHLAISVPDVEAASGYLSGIEGITALGCPQLVTEGPVAGDRWQYFRLPWGTYLELINMPVGVPFGIEHRGERFSYEVAPA